MADTADEAQEKIERGLENVLAAHRSSKPVPRLTCVECDVYLPSYRREFGTCIDCQREIEVRRFQQAYNPR